MDKFVIRTPRQQIEKKLSKPVEPKKKQTKIETLSRVVIVEKVQTQKDVLKNEASSASLICSTLKELHQSIPSKGVLLQTKIGHVVNKLRYHADPSVKEQARLLLKKWKGFYRELNARQELEVRSDLATERYRSKAKALIAKATGLKDDHMTVASIEKTVFRREKSVQMTYRKQIRTICMKVTHDTELRNNILSGNVTPESLVTIIGNAPK